MSIDYNTYVGPYVRAVFQMEPSTQIDHACTNVDCKNHTRSYMTNAFCEFCGSPIGDIVRTTIKPSVDGWELTEEINERLTIAHGDAALEWSEQNRVHLWKANYKYGGRNSHLDSHEDFHLEEITPAMITDDVARFTAFFEDAIDTLRARYGEDAISIHWGIIQDYY